MRKVLTAKEAVEKDGILSESAKPVIPESAAGGYPESRKNHTLEDTGSRPPEADSSGMTLRMEGNKETDSHG
jgi:hypothetical protein